MDRLWQIGRRAAEYFGSPQDLEWAIHGGELYLLQSRPITTLAEAEAYEDLLRTAARRTAGRALADERGPWVLHNLAETLPHPTPLTWSVIGRFMSGAGGFGEMYESVGFEPSPAVAATALRPIAGRVYMGRLRGRRECSSTVFRSAMTRNNSAATRTPARRRRPSHSAL